MAAFGDRFIVRRFSPVVTVAGGVILDSRPTKRANQYRLRILAGDDTLAMVELLVDEAEWGISKAEIAARLSLSLEETLRLALLSGALVLEQHGWMIDRVRVQQVSQQLIEAVSEFHRSTPAEPGIPRQELRSLFRSAPVFVIDAIIAATPELIGHADTVRMRSYTHSVSAEDEAVRRKLSSLFEKAGFSVPGVAEALLSTGLPEQRAKAILIGMVRSGVLLRLTDDLLLHASMLDKLRRILATHSQAAFTVSEFKLWAGVSRKHAVPLLELADRQKLTRRNGELRTVLPARPAS